jgi:hypothetical protein
MPCPLATCGSRHRSALCLGPCGGRSILMRGRMPSIGWAAGSTTRRSPGSSESPWPPSPCTRPTCAGSSAPPPGSWPSSCSPARPAPEGFAMRKTVLSLGIVLALLASWAPDAGARPKCPVWLPTEKCFCGHVPCCLDPPCTCTPIPSCYCLPIPPPKKPTSARPSSTVKPLRPIPGGLKANRRVPMSVAPVGSRDPPPSLGPRRGR